jgi:hypothetical protein
MTYSILPMTAFYIYFVFMQTYFFKLCKGTEKTANRHTFIVINSKKMAIMYELTLK